MMRGRRFRGVPIVLLVLLLGLTSGSFGVAAQGASPAASAGSQDLMTKYGPVQGKKPYKLAFMQVFPNLPFWQTMKDSVVARAKQDGVGVDVIALSPTGTIADQVAQLEDAVTKKYDGLIMGTIDAAGVVTGVQAANKAGIPVLSVDTAPAGGQLISLVQTNNVQASELAGEFIAKAIGEKGKVLNLQGDMANQTAQARNKGLHQALDKYPGIKVIDQSAHWQEAQGLSITENILTSDPDVKAIFGANDPPALGAVQALKAAGKSGVVVVGLDGTKDGLNAVKDGTFAADVAQHPELMGTVGVDLMVRHLNGEQVPNYVDTGTSVITKENVNQFLK